jgi:hypothetical protein
MKLPKLVKKSMGRAGSLLQAYDNNQPFTPPPPPSILGFLGRL